MYIEGLLWARNALGSFGGEEKNATADSFKLVRGENPKMSALQGPDLAVFSLGIQALVWRKTQHRCNGKMYVDVDMGMRGGKNVSHHTLGHASPSSALHSLTPPAPSWWFLLPTEWISSSPHLGFTYLISIHSIPVKLFWSTLSQCCLSSTAIFSSCGLPLFGTIYSSRCNSVAASEVDALTPWHFSCVCHLDFQRPSLYESACEHALAMESILHMCHAGCQPRGTNLMSLPQDSAPSPITSRIASGWIIPNYVWPVGPQIS